MQTFSWNTIRIQFTTNFVGRVRFFQLCSNIACPQSIYELPSKKLLYSLRPVTLSTSELERKYEKYNKKEDINKNCAEMT